MAKDYKNPELEKYLNKYISKLNIKKAFRPYIVDILMRRSYQYDLSPEEIQSDVVTLLNTLKKVKVVDRKELGSATAYAVYNYAERSIKICSDTIDKCDPVQLYSILAHELYHALTKEPYSMEDRLAGPPNKYTGQRNYSLLETIVEKSSYKTIYGTKTANAYFNENSSQGYKELTFVLDAIEAVYGVNEQALLRNAIKSREQLAMFLSSSIGEKKEDTLNFLDKLESHLARLHNARYPLNGKLADPNTQFQEIERGLADMQRVCAEKMSDRIENFSTINAYKLDDLKFDYNKLNAIFSYQANFFSYNYYKNYGIQKNIRSFLNNDTPLQDEIAKLYNRISQLDLVYENVNHMTPEQAKRLLNWAKCGLLQEFDQASIDAHVPNPLFLKDVGIVLDKNNKIPDRFYFIQRFRELTTDRNDSEHYTESWDNTIAYKLFKDLKLEQKKLSRMQFFKKIKNFFLGNNPQIALPIGHAPQIESSRTGFVENLKVPPEELNMNNEMNNSTQAKDDKIKATDEDEYTK